MDTDPGVGNGIPFPLPQDGAWDEAAESVSTTLNNLGVGPHFFAVRTRDNLGRWSSAVGDTVLVNMSLVVQVVSGQLVLSWNAEGGAPYHVYRADLPTGQFTEIDSTNAQTYTDTGIISSATKKFYYVTQTLNGALNNPPALNPRAIKN